MQVIRALLFTDLVDSTRRNDELGDAVMADWWESHDRTARALMVCWNGTEVGRSDGFFVLFDSARDAVGFALAYHRSLARLEPALDARVGIHVGAVTLRINSDDERRRGATPFEVDGVALPIVARVMSAAAGRQTLLSGAALQALGHTSLTLRNHGHWRLKGLTAPIELIEVGELSAPFAPPPDSAKAYRVVPDGDSGWKAVRELPHNLPAERDDFVGRQGTLQSVAARFDAGARLVSLLGIGGIGKTRLALRYGRLWLGDYSGGAWFCDLAAARTSEGIVHAVAQALDVQLGTGDPVRQLGTVIAGRGPCLLILDNFEQVASHSASTLGAWLDRAPEARFIVTSRERLGMPGELLVEVPPLEASAARTLFAVRAAAVAPFVLFHAADEDAIEPLLALLDHLPLAIELAAARAPVVSPAAMLQRIGERFRLLAARSGRIERQASLQAALDWSWELLANREQAALMQLSVFEGGFDAHCAEATVVLPDDSSGIAILDAVASLVDKSMVRVMQNGRFALLETVREYAIAQRRALGCVDMAPDGLVARHWRYFAGLSEARAVAHRCADLDNLVAACRAATVAGDAEGATGALVNAWAALRLVGPYRAAAGLAQQVLALPGLTPEQRGIAHAVAGSALNTMGDVNAAAGHLTAGLHLVHDRPPSTAVGRLHLAKGLQETLAGEVEAAADSLGQALELASQLADDRLKADVLTSLGRLRDHQARLPEAKLCYEAALTLARALGDHRLEGGLLGNLGGLLHDLGRLDDARQHYEQSLAVCEAVGDRLWGGNACSNLGLVLLSQDKHAEARHYLDRALAMAEASGNIRLAYTVRCNLGIALAAEGKLDLAESQFGLSVDAASASDDRRAEGQFLGYLAVTLARLGRPAEAHACLDRGETCLRALADRLSLAVLMCDRAEVARQTGDEQTARVALAGAELIADEIQCEPGSELRRRLAALALAPAS
jgi:predicted ATPase/class 3 adenylate cyclase/Tfp pilus assembly protein PilF